MPDTMMTNEQMQPRNNRSAEIDKLACSLAKAQGCMENAEKSAENPAFKRDGKASTYATLGSVWSAIRKPLADNGLAVMQWPRTVQGGVEIETELLHESGQYMRDILWLPCPQMTVHTVGSAITYGRRYALMAIVGIAPEDDDGNDATSAHKSGPVGMANAGTDFLPPGPRRTGWAKEAENDGLIDDSRPKGKLPAAKGQAMPINTPAAAGSAIKRIEWVKESVAFLRQDGTDEHIARDWWAENKARVDVIETALPTEYERLLDAYKEALEKKVPA